MAGRVPFDLEAELRREFQRQLQRQVARALALRRQKKLKKQPAQFPQFQRLPLELRQSIWEAFCPALASKSRLYCFYLMVREYAPEDEYERG